MNILISPDSYKGSIDAVRAADIIGDAFASILPRATMVKKPMADGGEGTLHTLSSSVKHEKIEVEAAGPLGERRNTWYIITEENLAIIECAEIAGLPLVPPDKRNPDHTTTFGIGEVIEDALDRGIRKFLIAIGGSSTNDGGFGMLQALGMQVRKKSGGPSGIYGSDLKAVSHIDQSGLDPRLFEAEIRIACDVKNPLTGPDGASHVYGPQKGASPAQVEEYDRSLQKYGELMDPDLMDTPGAGAAGGLGFAFLNLGASLSSGARLVGEAIHLEKDVKDADLVVTGEGQSDEQTLYGKAPAHAAKLAGKHGVPVFLISGSLKGDLNLLNRVFDACFSITPGPATVEECIRNAEANLYDGSIQIARALSVFLQKGGQQ